MASKYALHKAVIQGDTAEVLRILEGPEKVDVDERDAGGVPPIHYAIHLGNVPLLQLLLKHGMWFVASGIEGSHFMHLKYVIYSGCTIYSICLFRLMVCSCVS